LLFEFFKTEFVGIKLVYLGLDFLDLPLCTGLEKRDVLTLLGNLFLELFRSLL